MFLVFKTRLLCCYENWVFSWQLAARAKLSVHDFRVFGIRNYLAICVEVRIPAIYHWHRQHRQETVQTGLVSAEAARTNPCQGPRMAPRGHHLTSAWTNSRQKTRIPGTNTNILLLRVHCKVRDLPVHPHTLGVWESTTLVIEATF